MNCYLCQEPITAIHPMRLVIIGAPDAANLAKMKAGQPHSAPAALAHEFCAAPVTLTCSCCGFKETFPDCEAAFQAGWDEPTHLSTWPIACPLCPGVAAMGMIDHSEAHKRWKLQGRPGSFQDSAAMGDVPPL